MASKLSALLVQDRVVTFRQMDAAVQRQLRLGGRIGTNLLELGHVDEGILLYYLSKQRQIPAAERALFAAANPAAVALLTAQEAQSLGAVPVGLSDGRVQFIVTDGLPFEWVAAFGSRTGYQVEQFIVLEFRFLQALRTFYNFEPPLRFLNLIDQYPAPMGLRSAPEPTGGRAAVVVEPPAFDAGDASIPGLAWSIPQIVAFCDHAANRDEMLLATLGFVGKFFRRRLLLVVARHQLRGYAAQMPGGFGAVQSLEVEVDPDSPLASLARGESYFLGPAAESGADAIYAAAGLPVPPDCAIIPVKVGPRAALLLVGDGESEPLNPRFLPIAFVVINRLSAGLARLIRRHKERLTGVVETLVEDSVPRVRSEHAQSLEVRELAARQATELLEVVHGSGATVSRGLHALNEEGWDLPEIEGLELPPRPASTEEATVGALETAAEVNPATAEQTGERRASGASDAVPPSRNLESPEGSPRGRTSPSEIVAVEEMNALAELGQDPRATTILERGSTVTSARDSGRAARPSGSWTRMPSAAYRSLMATGSQPTVASGSARESQSWQSVDELAESGPGAGTGSAPQPVEYPPVGTGARPVETPLEGSPTVAASAALQLAPEHSDIPGPSRLEMAQALVRPEPSPQPPPTAPDPAPDPAPVTRPSDERPVTLLREQTLLSASNLLGYESLRSTGQPAVVSFRRREEESAPYMAVGQRVGRQNAVSLDVRIPGVLQPSEMREPQSEAERAFQQAILDSTNEELIGKLVAADRLVSDAAFIELLNRGPAAYESLMSVFPGPLLVDRLDPAQINDPKAVERHGPVLWLIGLQLGNMAHYLKPQLGSPDPNARYYATRLIQQASDASAVDAMVPLIFDNDEQTRVAALHYVERFIRFADRGRVLSELRKRMVSRDAATLEMAAAALGNLKDEDAVQGLIPLLDHDRDHTRQKAAQALSKITFQDHGLNRRKWEKWFQKSGLEGRHSWLLDAMLDKDWKVRDNAARELRTIPRLVVNYTPDLDRTSQQAAQRTVHLFLYGRPGGRA